MSNNNNKRDYAKFYKIKGMKFIQEAKMKSISWIIMRILTKSIILSINGLTMNFKAIYKVTMKILKCLPKMKKQENYSTKS